MRSCLKKENKSRHSLIGLSLQEAEAGKLPDPRSLVARLLSQDKTKSQPAQSLDSSAWELRQEGCWGVGGQPGLHSKSLFQREKTKDLRKSKS